MAGQSCASATFTESTFSLSRNHIRRVDLAQKLKATLNEPIQNLFRRSAANKQSESCNRDKNNLR